MSKKLVAKCPSCGEVIDHLECHERIYKQTPFKLDKKGKPKYGQATYDSDGSFDDSVSYVCPECGEEVAVYQEEAIDILTPKSEEE